MRFSSKKRRRNPTKTGNSPSSGFSRFLALVHEFRDEAQLLIVSHQKRTMETGDALYGVTMAPGGSSQVVSQRVEKEKAPA